MFVFSSTEVYREKKCKFNNQTGAIIQDTTTFKFGVEEPLIFGRYFYS